MEISAAPAKRSYTVTEAAELLGMCAVTIRRAINEGSLPAYRVRRQFRIPADVIARMLRGESA